MPASSPSERSGRTESSGLSELTLARAWQDGAVARELRTTDGRRVSIVYPGVWSHSNGPDFRDALIDLGGKLVSGAVELHLRASDWLRHRHQHDPAYDAVILHAVLSDDRGTSLSGPSGIPIATVELSSFLSVPLDDLLVAASVRPLGSLGSDTCLPTLAGDRSDLIRLTLRREGWRRLVEKQLRFSQSLAVLPPGEVLYRGILDGLGLVQNRAGMALLAEHLPLVVVEPLAGDLDRVLSALLGASGFLPLSPSHAAVSEIDVRRIVEIERLWPEIQTRLALDSMAPTSWNLNRVRPANHPVRRLASLSSLLHSTTASGLLGHFLQLPVDGGTSWLGWLDSARPRIGAERARQIAVNVLAPFAAAYADAAADDHLAESIGRLWETLPGSADDSIARGTLRQIVGTRRFPISLAIEAQGLHQIGRHGCRELRCFDCPIAMLALDHEPGHALREDDPRRST
jgi:hypothetical protein